MFGSQSKSAVRNAVHNNFASLFSEIVKIGCIYFILYNQLSLFTFVIITVSVAIAVVIITKFCLL